MRGVLLSLAAGLIFVTGFAVPEARDSEAPFIGTKNCRKCHLKQHKSWLTTKMAQSFELLKAGERADEKKQAGLDPDKDYTEDEACLPCHTTGYGKEGGFVSAEKTPELLGVGCEACHGAGGEYIKDEYMSLKNKEYKRSEVVAAGMIHPLEAVTCTVCHNDQSPFFQEFDFEQRKAEGIHKVAPLKYKHQ